MQTQRTLDEFKNEPFTDYSTPENKQAMEEAIEKVRGELGREYPMIVNGEKITIGQSFKASILQINRRLSAYFRMPMLTRKTLLTKRSMRRPKRLKPGEMFPPEERAEYLFKAADIIRERKHYYSAWMVFEVGKTWAEADGDTAEAIDFLEFYGREMLRWAGNQPIVTVALRRKK